MSLADQAAGPVKELLARPLPAALDMSTACSLLNIDPGTGYALVRASTFPVPVLRLGRAIRIPTRPLLELLGLEGEIAVERPRQTVA